MREILAFTLLFLIFLVPLASAQGIVLGIPEKYTSSAQILPLLIIPFICTFAIIFGILNSVRIRAIFNLIASFIIAIVLLYTGYLFNIVDYLYTYGTLAVDGVFILVALIIVSLSIRRGGLVGLSEAIARKYKQTAVETERRSSRLRFVGRKLQQKQYELDKLEKERNKYSSLADSLSGFIRRGDVPDKVWGEFKIRIGRSFRRPTDALYYLNHQVKRRDQRIARLQVETAKLKDERTKLSGEIKSRV